MNTAPANIDDLEDRLSQPDEGVIDALAGLDGDLLILGVGGKMGPTLARMAQRASDAAGTKRRVIGVARFSTPGVRERLDSWGIETIAADLLEARSLADLPPAPNLVFMAVRKFGATGNEPLTWAMNVLLPAAVAERYADSRFAAFSTGNVYPLVPGDSGGSLEDDPPEPIGEYGITCLGRERVLQYASEVRGTPMSLLRLNYAVELRYGVLVDLAQKVLAGEPIDLGMGHVNVIWQREANSMALQALARSDSPPFVVNLAGPEILSVRQVAEQFGERFDRPVRFSGSESPDALLSNGQRGWELFGRPRVNSGQLIDWIADWLSRGGPTLGKPTGFQTRDGRF